MWNVNNSYLCCWNEKLITSSNQRMNNKLLFIILLFVALLSACNHPYTNDGKQVRYYYADEFGFGSVKVDADPQTFEDLGDSYGRDAKHVFIEGKLVEGADGATFKYLGELYGVDANHVWHYDTIMSTADPKSFRVHNEYLTEDTADYYWYGRAVHVVDKQSFVILNDKNGFAPIWAKDKYNAYCMGYAPVPLADYESFHTINDAMWMSGDYAVDKYRVYFQDYIVEGADPQTFREVDFYVGQDKNCVYYKWKATTVRDYRKLAQVGIYYFTDGKQIYNKKLEEFSGVDPTTFRVLADNQGDCIWYVDRDHVWWYDRIVEGADVSTISPVYLYSYFTGKKERVGGVSHDYAKDAYHVFCRDSLMEGADPASFEIIDFNDNSSWTIFDKNCIYSSNPSKRLQKYLEQKYGKKR